MYHFSPTGSVQLEELWVQCFTQHHSVDGAELISVTFSLSLYNNSKYKPKASNTLWSADILKTPRRSGPQQRAPLIS